MPWGKVRPEGAYLSAFREALDMLLDSPDGTIVPLVAVENLTRARRLCREGSTWFKAYGARDAGLVRVEFFVDRSAALRPWVMARRRAGMSAEDVSLLEAGADIHERRMHAMARK